MFDVEQYQFKLKPHYVKIFNISEFTDHQHFKNGLIEFLMECLDLREFQYPILQLDAAVNSLIDMLVKCEELAKDIQFNEEFFGVKD